MCPLSRYGLANCKTTSLLPTASTVEPKYSSWARLYPQRATDRPKFYAIFVWLRFDILTQYTPAIKLEMISSMERDLAGWSSFEEFVLTAVSSVPSLASKRFAVVSDGFICSLFATCNILNSSSNRLREECCLKYCRWNIFESMK